MSITTENGFKVYLHQEMERCKLIKRKAAVVATKRRRSVRDRIERLLEERQTAKEGQYYGYDS